MDDSVLESLVFDLESDRVERKASINDHSKISQTICAFANDFPNHRQPGVLFIGVNDNGSCTNLPITDKLLQTLANLRSNGNILPFPMMRVQKKLLRGCEVAVIIVDPSDDTPVRYDGRTWIRVGPSVRVATAEEERHLAEKRRARDIPFDIRSLPSATLDDVDEELFRRVYLPSSIAEDILEQNHRSLQQQLVGLRFASAGTPTNPTILGILVIGKEPRSIIPGDYIQFLRIDGISLIDPIKNQEEIYGPLPDLLRDLDRLFQANISIATDITSQPTEIQKPDYPIVALQQLARNAIMHRTYEWTNAPVRITWFADRVEIQNPGEPYGQVNRENFGTPGITDYRNPHLAEAMKNLGYVQRFGIGISLARRALEENGNPPLEFRVGESNVLTALRKRP